MTRPIIERTISEGYQTPTDLEPVEEPTVPAHLVDALRRNVEAARSDSTRRSYDGDWNRFVAWCKAEELAALSAEPQTVAAYATALEVAGRKVSTIRRAMVAISQAHQLAGHDSPTADGRVREVLKGIARLAGVAQRQARPVLVEDLRAMVRALPDTLRSVRDRAMLVVGLAGGFRRSELVGLDVADLDFVPEGVVVTVRSSKTDQEGAGLRKGLPFGSNIETCPVRTLRAWLDVASIEEGPIFRTVTNAGEVTEGRASSIAVNRAVKRAARAAGLDPEVYSAHSLRAGLVTSAAKAGRRVDRIADMTGHRSEKVLRGYIREGNLFVDNAAAGIGL